MLVVRTFGIHGVAWWCGGRNYSTVSTDLPPLLSLSTLLFSTLLGKCHYAGTMIDGQEFDSSYKRGTPATFAPRQVIRGWTEAMQLMRPGDKWELYIPSELACVLGLGLLFLFLLLFLLLCVATHIQTLQ